MGDIAKLSACLDRLGGLNLSTLKDRKLLQKKIYILQESGLNLGYHFGWYIYGPYSPDLTRDAFDLSMQLTHAPKTMRKETLTLSEQSILRKLSTFLSSISSGNELADRLEAIASLHFLMKENPSLKESEVISKFKQLKGNRFRDKEIQGSMKKLRKSGIIRLRR